MLRCFERINVADYTSDSLPITFAYTNPDPNHGAVVCAPWANVNHASLGSFPVPPSNQCTAHGDNQMYCMDESGQKQYCRCDHVSFLNNDIKWSITTTKCSPYDMDLKHLSRHCLQG